MTIAIITGIIGLIGGNVTAFLYYSQNKKSKNLENEAKQSEEWHKLYTEAKGEMKERDMKIDALYQKIEALREEKFELHKENKKLAVDNFKHQILKCEVPNCQKRTPPTGY